MPSLVCVVCLDDLHTKTAMSTTCGHVFCSECAVSQFATHQSCPVCRTTQTFQQLIRLFPEYDTPAPDPPPSAVSASAATTTTSPEMPELEPQSISFRRFMEPRRPLHQAAHSQHTWQMPQLTGTGRTRPPAPRRPLLFQPQPQPRPQDLQMLQLSQPLARAHRRRPLLPQPQPQQLRAFQTPQLRSNGSGRARARGLGLAPVFVS